MSTGSGLDQFRCYWFKKVAATEFNLTEIEPVDVETRQMEDPASNHPISALLLRLPESDQFRSRVRRITVNTARDNTQNSMEKTNLDFEVYPTPRNALSVGWSVTFFTPI